MTGGLHGREHAWQGACMAGGVHGGNVHGSSGCAGQEDMSGRGHSWQERWPLKRAEYILLECILVV